MIGILLASLLILGANGCYKQQQEQTGGQAPSGGTPVPGTPTAGGQEPGSGTETPTAGEVKEFTIAITHTSGYSPNTFTVNKGDTVRFLATSDPIAHKHGIAIDELGVNVEVTKSPSQSPQAIEFVADEAGSFRIYCKTCESGPLGAHPWITGTLTVNA